MGFDIKQPSENINSPTLNLNAKVKSSRHCYYKTIFPLGTSKKKKPCLKLFDSPEPPRKPIFSHKGILEQWRTVTGGKWQDCCSLQRLNTQINPVT